MFLPESYGLDLRDPITQIGNVESLQHFWGRTLRVSFHSGDLAPIELKLHDERRFIDSLGRRSSWR